MKVRTLFLSCCVALTGCQLIQEPMEQVPTSGMQIISEFSELDAIKMDLPDNILVNVTSQSQIYSAVDSHVAVFKVPANRGELEFEITSYIRDTVFYPSALIMDSRGTVMDEIESDAFVYEKARLHLDNRVVANKRFSPPLGEEYVYVVIYTKKEDLAGSTEVMHPARLDAEARGNYLPEVKDIPIPHAKVGRLELGVEAYADSRIIINPQSEQSAMETPAQIHATSNTAAPKIKAPKTVVPETQQYYHNAIKTAVESNNIPKALSLLDEAKALNIDGAQEVFVKAVNAK